MLAEQPRSVALLLCEDAGLASDFEAAVAPLGYSSARFSSVSDLLGACDARWAEGSGPTCAVVDVTHSLDGSLGYCGPVSAVGSRIPTIAIVRRQDVRSAVRAMREGACDAIEAPFASDEVSSAITGAMERHVASKAGGPDRLLRQRLSRLGPSELSVLTRVVEGTPNKSIAAELGVSLRTVELRRAKIMRALEVDSLAELIRVVLRMPDEFDLAMRRTTSLSPIPR